MESKVFSIFFLISFSFTNATHRTMEWETKNPAFDINLYENVLDPAQCERQLTVIRRDFNLWLQFLDAGPRIPKYITQGNTLHMGNYYGCLGIQQPVDDSTIEGKFCMINVPTNQEINFPELPEFPEFSEGIFPNGTIRKGLLRDLLDFNQLSMDEELMEQIKLLTGTIILTDDFSRTSILGNTNFRMAVCVPKSCTVQEGLNGLLFNATALGFQYQEQFCRLPNDKPWAPADYVAIVTFSLIALLTTLSTLYDLRNRFILLKDPKSVNPIYTSFSVYTNALRLTTFNKSPGALECLDGIRSISMAWIIIGHTFATLPPYYNRFDGISWLISSRSIWISSAALSVDTFFLMSGMLLVYSSVGKMTSSKLIKNLHLFYLNRILRMFPLLALTILLQVSIFHWIIDGPQWHTMAGTVETCRNYWWLNLLYIQNYFAPICLGHTWYLAIDMQLYILAPILLYFVLSGSKRKALVALVAGLLTIQTASTIYVFLKKMAGSYIQPGRNEEPSRYMFGYYYFTLTRATPFLVGMIFGYILHLYRHKPKIPKSIVILLWSVFITLGGLSYYSPEPLKDINHDNQTMDSFVNAFSRTTWSTAIGCLIFVCVNGYGGPVNWLLSLQLWKMPSRISYSMYLLHYPLMFVISGAYVVPIYFSVIGTVYIFFSQFVITYVAGFFSTLVIDSPFSTVFKQLLGGGPKAPPKENRPQVHVAPGYEDPKRRQFKDGMEAENNSERL